MKVEGYAEAGEVSLQTLCEFMWKVIDNPTHEIIVGNDEMWALLTGEQNDGRTEERTDLDKDG